MVTGINNLKASSKNLRTFAIQLFFVFVIISGLMFYKNNSYWFILGLVGLLFLFIGLLMPGLLGGFYRAWMALGFVLAWIMTRLILTITFFLLITPLGLLLKLLRKDLLDRKMDKAKKTYWIKHKPMTDRSQYLRRF